MAKASASIVTTVAGPVRFFDFRRFIGRCSFVDDSGKGKQPGVLTLTPQLAYFRDSLRHFQSCQEVRLLVI